MDEIESGDLSNKTSPMDQIIQNPGFQHIAEKILLNLPLKDLITLHLVNKSLKEILDNPLFWIKKWISKGLSKKNQDDWIKAIQLMKNTKLAKIIILYIKKVLHRNCVVDMPCHIDEKMVENFSNFTDENAFQIYFQEAFEGTDTIKRSDAGSIQICIALVKNPNAQKEKPIKMAIMNDRNDIVQVLAPFIGNANTNTHGCGSPIQYAILTKKTEAIKLLAPFCDDYSYGKGSSLMHMAILRRSADAIKILAPFMKNPNALVLLAGPGLGETPIQLATRLLGPNHDIVQILQTLQ